MPTKPVETPDDEHFEIEVSEIRVTKIENGQRREYWTRPAMIYHDAGYEVVVGLQSAVHDMEGALLQVGFNLAEAKGVLDKLEASGISPERCAAAREHAGK